MIRLSKEQVLLLHRLLINQSGGSHGVRDEGSLDSSLKCAGHGMYLGGASPLGGEITNRQP